MKIQENISLKNYNTFGVEAKAHYFAEVHDLHELKYATEFAKKDPTDGQHNSHHLGPTR